MAAMIGRTRGWAVWLAGALCALVFGRGIAAGEGAKPKYGIEPRPQVGQAAPEPAGKVAALDEAPEWKQLVTAWADAEKFVAQRTDDAAAVKAAEEGRKTVLAGLESATKGLQALLGSGMLSAPEADLLKQGLAALSSRVRQWAMPLPMCYAPPPALMFERDSARRLADRLPLLEKLAGQKKIAPAVAGKLLASLRLVNVDGDLARLADEKRLAAMPADERDKILKTRDAAAEALKRLRAEAEESARSREVQGK